MNHLKAIRIDCEVIQGTVCIIYNLFSVTEIPYQKRKSRREKNFPVRRGKIPYQKRGNSPTNKNEYNKTESNKNNIIIYTTY